MVLRYAFGTGAIALQESAIYLHAAVVTLGIAYALKHDAHVRVDVFYSRLSTRARACIDLAGYALFLLPLTATLLYYTVPYAASSWLILEGSPEVGGIPATFLLKTLLPLMAATLFLQGLVNAIRALKGIRVGE